MNNEYIGWVASGGFGSSSASLKCARAGIGIALARRAISIQPRQDNFDDLPLEPAWRDATHRTGQTVTPRAVSFAASQPDNPG